MLCAIGDLVEDVIVLLSGAPRIGTDTDAHVERHRGGSAANVATAAAGLAGRARFVGQVGADELGHRLVAELERAGVDTAVTHAGRTGTVVVLVDPDGERTMLTDRGAATELDAVDPAWLADVTVLHVPAYSLAAGPLANTARELVALAHDRGIPVSVDTSSVSVLDELGGTTRGARDRLARLRPAVLLANGAEADHLALEAPLTDDGILVVKRGGEPTLLVAADGRRQEVPVPHAEVIDTTGAGDAFAAGFLLAWSGGAEPPEAVAAGQRAARSVVQRPGAGLEVTP